MLSDFLGPAGAAPDQQGRTAPERSQIQGKKCSEKMHEGNKKTSEKLVQVKNLYYLCNTEKNKRPGYPGND